MNHPNTLSRLRQLFFYSFLLLLSTSLSFSGFAEVPDLSEKTVFPGKVLELGSFMESSGYGVLGGGVELDAGIQLAGDILPWDLPLVFEALGGYRYRVSNSEDERASLQPFLCINSRYRFDLFPGIASAPGISFDFSWPFDSASPPAPVPAFGLSLIGDLQIFIRENKSLSLYMKPGWSFGGVSGIQFSIGIRLQQDRQIMIPVKPGKLILHTAPKLFSPDDDGLNDKLLITWDISPEYANKNTELSIFDPQGQLFYYGNNIGARGEFLWDGTSNISANRGELVSSATSYSVVLSARDILGRTKIADRDILVDVLVIREGEGYKIRIPNIQFPPDSADFSLLENPEQINSNHQILKRLGEIFETFPEYSILIVGHANADSWNDVDAFLREQEDELIPLSLNRSTAIREALINIGIKKERLDVRGVGASEPLVPFSDEINRWKNRRVEFLLIK